MVILNYGGFRVMSIDKFDVDESGQTKIIEQPTSEGLAIEHIDENNEHYVVIAFVKPDSDFSCCSYQSVGNRIEEYTKTWSDVNRFRLCLKVAQDEILRANGIEAEDD